MESNGRLLQIENVVAGYGRVEVLHDVSIYVEEREVVAIIGPNGAGKSTVLKVIAGFIAPKDGKVFFSGENISGLRPDLVVRKGLAYVPQGRVVFPKMTVLENLEMGAFLIRDGKEIRAALERVYRLFPILAERKHQRADTLSGGEQQMLSMGRALMISPKMVLLDEPSLGLAPRFVDLVFQKIAELKESGMTLVIVEQNASRALGVADRGYVLELGQNRFHGSGRELLEDERVKRLYLGA